MDIVQKIVDLLNYTSAWFDKYIFSGLAGFLRGLGNLIIKVLEFFIDVIRWLLGYL